MLNLSLSINVPYSTTSQPLVGFPSPNSSTKTSPSFAFPSPLPSSIIKPILLFHITKKKSIPWSNFLQCRDAGEWCWAGECGRAEYGAPAAECSVLTSPRALLIQLRRWSLIKTPRLGGSFLDLVTLTLLWDRYRLRWLKLKFMWVIGLYRSL